MTLDTEIIVINKKTEEVWKYMTLVEQTTRNEKPETMAYAVLNKDGVQFNQSTVTYIKNGNK
jgi:hypothetical protein